VRSFKISFLGDKQIKRLVGISEVLKIVEAAFRAQAQGRVQMPSKIYLHLDKYMGDFRAMPAYIESLKACGIKWVNVHPENKKYALPAVMALIILNDPKTGIPLAIMDGTYITNLRTGAAGALAAKFLARKNSKRIALIGSGAQAETQILALREIFKIELVTVYDINRIRAQAFIRKMKFLDIFMRQCFNIEDCVNGADIIVTTTPSRKPLVKADWISSGVHINAIGADAKGKEELDPVILKKARIFVDDVVQASHSGEINLPLAKGFISPKSIRATLGEVIIGKKKGRISPSDITVFDSTGLAILDIAVANYVYEKNKKRSKK